MDRFDEKAREIVQEWQTRMPVKGVLLEDYLAAALREEAQAGERYRECHVCLNHAFELGHLGEGSTRAWAADVLAKLPHPSDIDDLAAPSTKEAHDGRDCGAGEKTDE